MEPYYDHNMAWHTVTYHHSRPLQTPTFFLWICKWFWLRWFRGFPFGSPPGPAPVAWSGGTKGWPSRLEKNNSRYSKKKWEAKSKRNGYPFSRFSSAASLDCTPALVKTVRHGKVLIHSWPEKRQTEARGCLITEIYQYSSCLGLRFGGVIYILRVLSSEVLHMGPEKKPCRSL